MRRHLYVFLLIPSLILSLGSAAFGQATESPESKQRTKEFVMSCAYGVLAGTVVGAASLAFTNRPGDNLNKVARGASIGLYAGILLGLYVVYAVPGDADEEADDYAALQPKFFVHPVISEKGVDGAGFQYEVMRF